MMLKVIWGLLLLLTLLAQYRLWVGDGSIEQVLQMEKAIAIQQAENNKLQERNDKLAERVTMLKQDSEAVESLARKELGMIKEGEAFYLVVTPDLDKPSN